LTKKHDVHPCPAVKNRYSIQLVAREKIRRKTKSIIWEKKSKEKIIVVIFFFIKKNKKQHINQSKSNFGLDKSNPIQIQSKI